MATFVLNDATAGRLGGGQFKTIAKDMEGSFREVQLRMTQSTVGGDAEVHFLEFHFTVSGVSKEDL